MTTLITAAKETTAAEVPLRFVQLSMYVCVISEMKNKFKFSTYYRDSNSNKWLDAMWMHCRDTSLLGRHR